MLIFFGLKTLCWFISCVSQAIQSPAAEHAQKNAWSAVVPLVSKLKTFYEFSHKLGNKDSLLLHFYYCLLPIVRHSVNPRTLPTPPRIQSPPPPGRLHWGRDVGDAAAGAETGSGSPVCPHPALHAALR